jgi:hypothetical protein
MNSKSVKGCTIMTRNQMSYSFPKGLCITTGVFLLTLSIICGGVVGSGPPAGIVPKDGFVPDQRTAVKIAEAVIEPIFGLQSLTNERPLVAKLKGGEWFVNGTAPTNIDWRGGVVEVHINKTNGCITFLTHWK